MYKMFNKPIINFQYSLWGGSKSRLANGTVFDVESYIVHPKFDPYILDYDIAVIKITQTFRGVKNIQRAILANEACRTGSGARVRVVGWGLNDERILPEYLLQIKQYTLDQDACLKGNE